MKLKAENISMAYDKKQVIDNISFTLSTGEITSLVGRNGSGKTTILKILSQILDPQSGEVLIDEKDLSKNPEMKINYAFLPDRFDFFSYDTGLQAMEYYKIIYPEFDSEFAITEAEKLGLSLKDNIRTLSKGNKALLGLIISLATNAKFLFLDEVLDGMDVLNKDKIMGYIIDAATKDRSILISSHQLQELQGISDRVIYLNLDGKINEVSNEKESDILKLQVVTKNELPKDIENISVVRQHIGRVYTILIGDKEGWEELFNKEEIVQYDKLPVHLEDLFYWEQGGDMNERI
jgi:ABC-2 type transport system ATP-binding protein